MAPGLNSLLVFLKLKYRDDLLLLSYHPDPIELIGNILTAKETLAESQAYNEQARKRLRYLSIGITNPEGKQNEDS